MAKISPKKFTFFRTPTSATTLGEPWIGSCEPVLVLLRIGSQEFAPEFGENSEPCPRTAF